MVNKYTEITEGKVTNIVLALPETAAERGWLLNTGESIGDLWDGNAFTKPPKSQAELAEKNAAVREKTKAGHLRVDMESKLNDGDLAGAIRLLDQIYQAELAQG